MFYICDRFPCILLGVGRCMSKYVDWWKAQKKCSPLEIRGEHFSYLLYGITSHLYPSSEAYLTADGIVRVRPQRLLIGSNPRNCNPRSMHRRRVYVLGVALVDDEVIFLTNDTYASFFLVAVVVAIAAFAYTVLGTTGSHQLVIVLDGVELYLRYDILFLIHCLNVIVSLRG